MALFIVAELSLFGLELWLLWLAEYECLGGDPLPGSKLAYALNDL